MSTTPTACTECRVPLVPQNYKGRVPDGLKRHSGHGMCAGCYSRWRRSTVVTLEVPDEPGRPTTEQNRVALAYWLRHHKRMVGAA